MSLKFVRIYLIIIITYNLNFTYNHIIINIIINIQCQNLQNDNKELNNKTKELNNKNESKKLLQQNISQALTHCKIEEREPKEINSISLNLNNYLDEIKEQKISKELEIKIFSEMVKNLNNSNFNEINCFVCDNTIKSINFEELKINLSTKIEKISRELNSLSLTYNHKNETLNE